MRKYVFTTLLGASLLSTPFLVGCDTTKSEHKVETTRSDGSKTVDHSKTTVDGNGNTTTTTEHKQMAP